MLSTAVLAPCIVCNRPVSIDCRCRICNGRLHCFCAVPEGKEGHGGFYLCSADCQVGQRNPPSTPTRINVHVGGEVFRSPIPATNLDDSTIINELPPAPPLLDDRGNANFLCYGDESNYSEENSGSDSGSDGGVPQLIDKSVVATAKSLLSNHPLKKFERLKRWTKAQLLAARQQDVEPVETFLRNICDLPYCFNFYHCRFSSCTCLTPISQHFLFEDVAEMLGNYFCFCFRSSHIQLSYLAEVISFLLFC